MGFLVPLGKPSKRGSIWRNIHLARPKASLCFPHTPKWGNPTPQSQPEAKPSSQPPATRGKLISHAGADTSLSDTRTRVEPQYLAERKPCKPRVSKGGPFGKTDGVLGDETNLNQWNRSKKTDATYELVSFRYHRVKSPDQCASRVHQTRARLNTDPPFPKRKWL